MNNRTKKCPYCTKDIPIDTKICPRCGMKQKRSFNFSNFRIILSIIPIGISVFFALHNMGGFLKENRKTSVVIAIIMIIIKIMIITIKLKIENILWKNLWK
ncbi:hypothetical protein AC231_07465 [Clostridium pasteurianum]|uniref:zinc ribbon domain-containing protein n=1 Tax=Clostridium pasteurianum TaxID=1501 RepID=UPI00097B3515|nr:zinc ribbon domain-containing protein [Clostridium pasteurianum]OMH20536.1 hypothetical protein AC231_07465 [Clostridium pasteurianum]